MVIPEDDPPQEPCFGARNSGQPRSPQTASNTYEDSALKTSTFTCRSGKPLSVIVSHESGEWHSAEDSADFELDGQYTLTKAKLKGKKKERLRGGRRGRTESNASCNNVCRTNT